MFKKEIDSLAQVRFRIGYCTKLVMEKKKKVKAQEGFQQVLLSERGCVQAMSN